MRPVLPLALQKIENEYLLFGAAGLVSLVAFVALIFVPAIGSYGRIWEKAAAGFLSVIVLVALVLTASSSALRSSTTTTTSSKSLAEGHRQGST